MLTVSKEVYNQVVDHVKASYPHECCGVLVGEIQGDVKKAHEAHPIKNLNTERAHDRYNMDPIEFSRVEKDIAKRKLEIVGIYHSHPDHPSRPSQTDFQHAWPVYSYIIFGIAKGVEIYAQNWCLNDENTQFVEESYKVIE